MNLGLKDKLAICTGNSKGIGKAISDVLREEGATVPDISRTNGYDLMSTGLIDLLYNYRSADILINNLGGGGRWGNEDCTAFNEWDQVYRKNTGIATILTMEYLKGMKERKWGRVITISSIYGKETGARPWFAMAKSAQIALMKTMASQRIEGVTFNTISPGEIDVGKTERKDYFGKPEDIGYLVAFLCSDKAKYINGANITIDGGVSHSF